MKIDLANPIEYSPTSKQIFLSEKENNLRKFLSNGCFIYLFLNLAVRYNVSVIISKFF